MYRGSNPRILPIIVIILVIALLVAAAISVGRLIFVGDGNGDDSQPVAGSMRDAVLDTSETRRTILTVRGPIVADENYRSYQITISPSSRNYTLYSGYLEQVIEEKSFDNNNRAYEEFVYALDKANISKTKNAKEDEFRGVCATEGIAFMFEAQKDQETDQSVWTSTCKGSAGTMGADIAQVHALFANQIPEFTPQFNQYY